MHYFTAKFAVYCCVCRLQTAQTWVQGGNVSRSECRSTCACFIACQLEALIFLFQRCMSSFELSFSCFLYWSLGFIWSSFISRLAEWTLWNNFMYLTPSYFPSGRYCGNFFIFFSPKICCLAEAIVCFYFCIFPSQLGGRGSVPQFSKKLLPKP